MACAWHRLRNRFQVRIRLPEFKGKGISSSRTNTFRRRPLLFDGKVARVDGGFSGCGSFDNWGIVTAGRHMHVATLQQKLTKTSRMNAGILRFKTSKRPPDGR